MVEGLGELVVLRFGEWISCSGCLYN